jgi:hypothetical protein
MVLSMYRVHVVMGERFAPLPITRIRPMRHGESIAETKVLIRRMLPE